MFAMLYIYIFSRHWTENRFIQ